MTDRPVRAVAQELVNDLDVLSGQVRQLVEAEIAGSTIPGRTMEPVSGGDPSDPTMDAAERVDPVLAKTVKLLEKAKGSTRRVVDYLSEADPDYRLCQVCGGCNGLCRAVRPRPDPRWCHSCYKHWVDSASKERDRRHRTPDEVRAHRERMRAREADRAEQARERRRAG